VGQGNGNGPPDPNLGPDYQGYPVGKLPAQLSTISAGRTASSPRLTSARTELASSRHASAGGQSESPCDPWMWP
jgi:hypothetical protein